jgi:hypothetical protein
VGDDDSYKGGGNHLNETIMRRDMLRRKRVRKEGIYSSFSPPRSPGLSEAHFIASLQ